MIMWHPGCQRGVCYDGSMTANRSQVKFPKKFLWGAATSAHQVEGGLHNQWTVWELENAKRLAIQSPYRFGKLGNWSAISREAKNPNNYVSGRAVDHFNRYEQDFEIAKSLNLNSLRCSIEWSRIEPKEGEWSQEAIDHYRAYFKKMKEMGLEPVVTLFHFTLPVWFADMGGFEKTQNVRCFVRFAEKVLNELGDSFKWVITVNEPEVYVTESYRHGEWPPQKNSRVAEFRVLLNLALAHRLVVSRARGAGSKFKFSIAKNSSYIYAGDDAWLSRFSAKLFTWRRDDWFLWFVAKHCDFIGLNYYFSDRIYGYRAHNPNYQLNDLGWDMQPANIQFVLERLSSRYGLPILITENGLADGTDEQRQWWITETIRAMSASTRDGVKLIGYLHWSLLDNFEWDKGFWPKFGLVSVNRSTMQRTPRPSAKWLGGVIGRLSK